MLVNQGPGLVGRGIMTGKDGCVLMIITYRFWSNSRERERETETNPNSLKTCKRRL